MRSSIPAIALALLLPAAVPAQIIRGIVLEEGTTTAIAGTTVELLAPDSTVQATADSDQKGWFQLEAKQEGRFLIRTSHPFYTAGRIDSVTMARHETVTIVLRMGRSPIPLQPLVVTARSRNPLQRFLTRAEQGRPGRFIMRDYIERRVARPPSELLRMTPGVQLVRSNMSIPTNTIMLRGAPGGCAANVFLDGLPVTQDSTFGIDDLTASDLIEGIEIYDSYDLIPPEFLHTLNTCGVVAFWSRADARGPFKWKKLGIAAALAGVVLLLAR